MPSSTADSRSINSSTYLKAHPPNATAWHQCKRTCICIMSYLVCARCLWRLQSSQAAAISHEVGRSSFHSTASQYGSVMKAKKNVPGRSAIKFREARGATIKKKKRDRPRPPAPGERKAARTRIVLSNTNAMDVQGLQELTKDNMMSTEHIGEMLAGGTYSSSVWS